MTKGTVVIINGGLGKCIMFTAVAKSFKHVYPEVPLIVISGYPEVFLNNPNIIGNFPFTQHGLWVTYTKNHEYDVVAWDPYHHRDWMANEPRHLTDIWCDLLDIDSLYMLPELHFSGPEVAELQAMIQTELPLLVVQSSGGSNPAAVSWTRNPPKEEYDAYVSRYKDTHYIVHLCVPNTPVLPSAHQRLDNLSRRQAMCLVHYANEFIGIDSYGLHARAANPNAGPSTFFFPLPETVERLAYPNKGFNYVPLTEQARAYLEKGYSYYSTTLKYGIEELAENCPVPAGVTWFDF